MSSSNCCFLTCIQISQGRSGGLVFPSKNFPQFVVIHIVKGFGIINKAEVDVFLELSCFFYDPTMLAICSLVLLSFLNLVLASGISWSIYYWSLAWRILSIILLACDRKPAKKPTRNFGTKIIKWIKNSESFKCSFDQTEEIISELKYKNGNYWAWRTKEIHYKNVNKA